MIYKTCAVALLFIMNACSPSETETTEIVEANVTIETRTSDEQPYVYLEELHYMYLISEFGEEHPLIPGYREQFEEIAAGIKPGSGCPSPRPCDTGGIANCKAFLYEQLEGMLSFSEVYDVNIGIYTLNGEPFNTVTDVMAAKCPKPNQNLYTLEEPLEGNGYFEISFASEFTEGELVSFQILFEQQ